MKTLRTNRTLIHYDVEGADQSKPTLAFVNSLGTDFRIWDGVRQALSPQFNLVFHDKRGHGLSAFGDAPHKIETYAEDLAGILDHLEFKQVTAVGLSIGGLIVLALFHARPDLVAKLVISNSAVKIGTNESWTTRIATVKSGGIDSIADSVMKLWYSEAFHTSNPDQVALSRTMMTRQNVLGYVAACEALRAADFTSQAASIKIPTLFIGGQHDGSTPPSLVEASSKLVPGAKFEIIANCAHIPCVERPNEWADLVRSFANS